MNLFKEMFVSVYDFKSYKSFLKNKKSKIFFFGLLLISLYFIVTFLVPVVRLEAAIGSKIPEFELKDGTLWIAEPFELDYGDTYVYADTDPEMVFYEADEMEQYLQDYSKALLVDSEKMILKENGQVSEIYYSDLEIESFSKEELLGYLPYLYLISAVVLLVFYIVIAMLFFFGALIIALLGMIVASCMKYQLTFGQLYILALYSRTLPLLLKAIVSYLPFGIPFFWVINFGLSLLYVSLAIQKLKEQKLEKPLEFGSQDGTGLN